MAIVSYGDNWSQSDSWDFFFFLIDSINIQLLLLLLFFYHYSCEPWGKTTKKNCDTRESKLYENIWKLLK